MPKRCKKPCYSNITLWRFLPHENLSASVERFKGSGSAWLRVTHKPWGLEITSRCRQISNIPKQTSWIKHSEAKIQNQTSWIKHPDSWIKHPDTNIQKQTSWIKHAKPIWKYVDHLEKAGNGIWWLEIFQKIKTTWTSGDVGLVCLGYVM